MGSTKGIWDGNKNGDGNRMNRGGDQREGDNYTEQRGMDKIKINGFILFDVICQFNM